MKIFLFVLCLWCPLDGRLHLQLPILPMPLAGLEFHITLLFISKQSASFLTCLYGWPPLPNSSSNFATLLILSLKINVAIKNNLKMQQGF